MIQTTQNSDATVRVLHCDPERELQLLGGFGTNNSVYGDVLSVRNHDEQGGHSYRFDGHSMHYVVFFRGNPIGSLTTPRWRDGEIDCQSFYPPQLFNAYGPQIVSACKFRIRANQNSGMSLLRLTIREAWRDQLAAGVRLDLINVERRLVPFYKRIGYVVINGSDFVHPTLGTNSIALALPADPDRRSFCQDLFAEIDDPLPLGQLLSTLNDARPVKPR